MTIVASVAQLALLLALQAAPVQPSPSPSASPSASPSPKAEILGIWKGTSICTKVEGNEYCRDEAVVYNVIDVPGQPQTVKLKAARVVDEALLPMYELFFSYRADANAWSCEFERPRMRGVWWYVVHGDEMTGTAKVLPAGKIVRNVSVKRAPPDPTIAH